MSGLLVRFATDPIAHATISGESDGVMVALEGRPRWLDPDLTLVAEMRGPAAAAAAGWRRFGEALPSRMGGPFALVVRDDAAGRLLAAIDRMGIHGLAYGRLPGGGVAVASDCDGLRPLLAPSPSPQAVHDFLYFLDRVPAPTTIWQGIAKLRPGEMLVADAAGVRTRPYWRPHYAASPARPEDLAEELRATLAVAVNRACDAGGSIGCFLSGGLDSSTVCGLAAARLGGALPAFTIGFDDPRYDETRYAAIAAARFRLDHRVRTATPEQVMAVMETVATAYDEPFANSSAVPTLLCARAAREAGVTVMLAGDGGDELFAGNERYLKDTLFQAWGRVPAPLRHMAERLCPHLPPVGLLRKLAKYVRRASQQMAVRVSGDNLFALRPPHEVFTADFLAAVDVEAPRRHVQALFDGAEADTDLQRFLVLDHHLTLADGDLRKVGRMCALAGVEVRYPMLDDAVVALSTRLPSALLCRDGRLRGFYKDAFAALLPPEIIAKPKHGFGLPYSQILASHPPLRALARDALAALRRHGWFRPDYLDAVAANPGDGITWDLVTLSLWAESRLGR